MAGWKWFLLFLSTGYLALAALMYLAQRGLMYFPESVRTSPADAGLSEAEEVDARHAGRRARHRLAHPAARRPRRSGSTSTAMAARCAIASTAFAN